MTNGYPYQYYKNEILSPEQARRNRQEFYLKFLLTIHTAGGSSELLKSVILSTPPSLTRPMLEMERLKEQRLRKQEQECFIRTELVIKEKTSKLMYKSSPVPLNSLAQSFWAGDLTGPDLLLALQLRGGYDGPTSLFLMPIDFLRQLFCKERLSS